MIYARGVPRAFLYAYGVIYDGSTDEVRAGMAAMMKT